jgi:hypothetical protein
MNHAWISLAILWAFAAEPTPARSTAPASTAAKPADPKASFSRYQVVIDRSIFSRSRKPAPPPVDPAAAASAKSAADAARAAEQARIDPGDKIILVGIASEDGQAYAFFEDGDGKIKRLKSGESMANRKITFSTLDQIEAELDGSKTVIVLSQTLTGKTVARSAPTSGAGSGATASGSPAASSPALSGKELSIAERMRLRREAELGKPGGPPPSTSAPSGSSNGGKSRSGDRKEGDRRGDGKSGGRPEAPGPEGDPEGAARVEIMIQSSDGQEAPGEGIERRVLFLQDVPFDPPPPPQP